MRMVLALILIVATITGAIAQTFLGNCVPPQVLGFQLGTPFGVYCYPSPATPCGAGQLDYSVSTGCNLVWAGH